MCIVVKGSLVQLVTNIPTVMVQVGADEFTGDVRRVGVGRLTDFPGVVNQEPDETLGVLRAHFGPWEVSKDD